MKWLRKREEVLVFLITCINGHWKIPVGYFCIDGLSGGENFSLEVILNKNILQNELVIYLLPWK